MDATPNRIQEQNEKVADRKPTSPEGAGPLTEEVNAATKHSTLNPAVPTGSEVTGWERRRDSIWPEVHYPMNGAKPNIDPRTTGDPVGGKEPE